MASTTPSPPSPGLTERGAQRIGASPPPVARGRSARVAPEPPTAPSASQPPHEVLQAHVEQLAELLLEQTARVAVLETELSTLKGSKFSDADTVLKGVSEIEVHAVEDEPDAPHDGTPLQLIRPPVLSRVTCLTSAARCTVTHNLYSYAVSDLLTSRLGVHGRRRARVLFSLLVLTFIQLIFCFSVLDMAAAEFFLGETKLYKPPLDVSIFYPQDVELVGDSSVPKIDVLVSLSAIALLCTYTRSDVCRSRRARTVAPASLCCSAAHVSSSHALWRCNRTKGRSQRCTRLNRSSSARPTRNGAASGLSAWASHASPSPSAGSCAPCSCRALLASSG